jgi:diacylglycerol kinase
VIKDVAAAAVGISIAVWAVIVVVEVARLWPRLFG